VVASSNNAILRYTDNFIALQDGECAVLEIEEKPKYKIYNFQDKTAKILDKKIHKIDGLSVEDISK
jgi:glucosamine 6-phosphate synthetase-like amidotransferase/phosphosugar isomerase protein